LERDRALLPPPLSFSAARPILCTLKSMRISPSHLHERVLEEWERRLASLPANSFLRPLITESWERCRTARIDREDTPLHRISQEELGARLERNGEALSLIREHLEWLSATLTVPHVVYFADADGIILHSIGNAPDLLAEGLTPGHDWSEARMGTNGAGTALVTGGPVAVVGPEHYVHAFEGCTCTAAPIRDPAGSLIGAIDLSTPNLPDVPGRLSLVTYAALALERELAAQLRQRSEERYRVLAESSPDAILVVFEDRFVYANPAAVRLLGVCDAAGILGRSVAEFIQTREHRDSGSSMGAEAPGATGPAEYRWHQADGTRIEVATARASIVWEARPAVQLVLRPSGVAGRAETLLAEREERLHRIADSGMIGVIYWRLDGSVTFANDYFLELTGYDREDLASGRIDWRAMTPPEWAPADAAAVDEVARTGVTRPFEKEYVRKDGGRVPVLLSAATFPGIEDEGVTLVLDLRERNRAFSALEESRRALARQLRITRTITDNATAALVLMGSDGRAIFWNPAWEEMTGFGADEIRGQVLHDLIHHTRGDGTPFPMEECPLDRALPNGVVVRGHEDVFVRKDGTFFPVSCAAMPVHEGGEPVGTVIEIRDISEQKGSEHALRQSEARLRSALSAARMGTWDIDLVAGEVHRSESTDVLFGLPPTGEPRTIGTYLDRVHPDDVQRVQEAIAESLEHGTEHQVRYRIVQPDGTEYRVFSRGEVIRDTEGRPARLLGAVADETALHQAESALRESEERFRTLADSIPQLAWMADAEGAIFWFNQRWLEYTGVSAEQMKDGGWQRVHHPDWVDGVSTRFQAALASGEPWEDTFPLRGADGEYRWFLSRAVPILDDRDRIVRWLGTNTDVTAQRDAAAERERLYQEAQSANQAKGDFLAVMSHELRTPLNAIIGYADLLDLGVPVPLPDHARRYVQRIRLAAQHQKQLIDTVLAFSRLEAGGEPVEVELLCVDELLQEIAAVIAPLAQQKSLDFLVDTATAPEVIGTDPRKLRQILVNLLGNAVKFTREGHVALCIEQWEHSVLFVIEDSGIGIEPDQQQRIFEPFWQGDRSLTRSVEGTGLGLSISRRFAQMLGGDIVVESTPGEGSTFVVVLPRDPSSPPSVSSWDNLGRRRRQGRGMRRVD
jgi:PAS domain S-box-containing protein